jgi:H+/Cl- antiporter ClcA
MLSVGLDIFGLGIGLVGFFFVIGLLATIFWIVALVDAARRQFYDPNMKIVWILVVFFLHFLGALVYWFAGRQQGDL